MFGQVYPGKVIFLTTTFIATIGNKSQIKDTALTIITTTATFIVTTTTTIILTLLPLLPGEKVWCGLG
jgi:hypothetical protein